MIGNDAIQAAIIARLKADTNLTTWLAARSSAGEIRETQYQGVTYAYPAVRVSVGDQFPEGDTCYTTRSVVLFEIWCFSEQDSSWECDQLAKLASDAVFGRRISGTGFASLAVTCESFPHSTHTGDKLWQAFAQYRMEVRAT